MRQNPLWGGVAQNSRSEFIVTGWSENKPVKIKKKKKKVIWNGNKSS